MTADLVAIARRPRSRRPAGFCATYLISLFFVLPVFVFASPYAAVGGMTAAHGLQYLVLVSNISLIGGAALNAASHLHGAGHWGTSCSAATSARSWRTS